MKRFSLLFLAVMAVGCIQDPEEPFNLPDTPTLSVDETSVTRVSMVVNGSFGKNMTDITAYGVEISETLFESGGTYKTLVPQEMGADGFSLGVSDLKSNGTYFLRAFISNGHSRMYSTTLTQKTPETSVASISDVTLKDDYYLVATVEDNGGRSIEDVGFMWSTSAERKDIKREKRYPATLNEDGKTFTLPVNEVGEGTHYIMAYAEDDKDGTGYSRIPFEWVVTSDQGVAIEDPNFKKYLLMYHDGNEDGKMSYAEMEAIESIDVHTDNIKTVREINMMPRLHSLVVSGTQQGSGQLTSLDMSKNTGLSALDCSNNKIRQLDASSISGLVYLNCDGNPMDTLFMSYYQELGMLQYPEGTVIKYVDAPAVEPEVELAPVDLGLSVKWANLNLGSKSPEAYGDYYAWGETETKTEYNWSTYKWANGSINSLTKYNTESDYGVVDNNSTLEAEDDVASVRLGGLWRMPTEDEWRELRNKCTWTWTSVNDVEGYQVSNSNGVSIFLPTGGSRNYGSHNDAGSRGLYWSASVGTGYPGYAWSLAFDSKDFFAYNYRYEGLSVRPVWGERPEKPGMTVNKYLTFTSEGASKLSLNAEQSNGIPLFYYSYDLNSWYEWDGNDLSFAANKPLYLCGDNPDGINFVNERYVYFQGGGDFFAVSGDIMSLIQYDSDLTIIPCDGCFDGLFALCTQLTSAPALPATGLTERCYQFMFYGCTALTSGPELPATELANNCYRQMFEDCTSLTSAPSLPAMTMAYGCYWDMFSGCASLAEAPTLSSTSLAFYCYASMFEGCISLTTVPELPSTTLVSYCYQQMFQGCTGLTSAPELPANSLPPYAYQKMFFGCSALGHVKCLATDISAYNCVDNWLEGVPSSGTFVKAAAMNDWPSGPSGIPEGWMVVNDGNNTAVDGAVDLGLSVLWASSNIGATKPEEYGSFYSWGEIETKDDYSASTYKWYESSTGYTKYNFEPDFGLVDNLVFLDDEDDVAFVTLGDKWRMPTRDELNELISNCEWTWTELNGVSGYRVTSKVNANSIFLPAAGSNYGGAGETGWYWTSYLSGGTSTNAEYLVFEQDDIRATSVDHRTNGYSVRPVYGEKVVIPVTGVEVYCEHSKLQVGESASLVCRMTPYYATDRRVTIISGDSSVANVSGFLVTAVSPGIVSFTITTADGGYTDTCTITVE